MARYHCELVAILAQSRLLTLLVIQTQAIDDAYRTVSHCDEAEKRDEGKKIVEDLARLKYEVQHNRELTWVFCRNSKGAVLRTETGQFVTMATLMWLFTTQSWRI